METRIFEYTDKNGRHSAKVAGTPERLELLVRRALEAGCFNVKLKAVRS